MGSSLVNYSKLTDRHMDDKRFERELKVKENLEKAAPSAGAGGGEAAPSATYDAFVRMEAGLNERTIADKINDPNRVTWEHFKKENEDKLDIAGKELKKMIAYRKELDDERDRALKKAKQKVKDRKEEDGDSDDDSSEAEGRKRKKRKKDKKKKKKKRKAMCCCVAVGLRRSAIALTLSPLFVLFRVMQMAAMTAVIAERRRRSGERKRRAKRGRKRRAGLCSSAPSSLAHLMGAPVRIDV
ncbi:unnamed protein product [Chrysoparadoxa australica]